MSDRWWTEEQEERAARAFHDWEYGPGRYDDREAVEFRDDYRRAARAALAAAGPPSVSPEPDFNTPAAWEQIDSILQPDDRAAVSPPEEPAEGRVWMHGQWWQVEQVDVWDAPDDTDRTTVYYEDEPRPDRAVPLYRLVPVSQEPPK